MSLSIKALNNDTSLLLSFSPTPDSSASETMTVLLDPWIVNTAAVTISPAIATLIRPTESAISSLADLTPQPDLICISQNAPDHCHPDTLRTLPEDSRCRILAAESTAATVRGFGEWFSDSHRVEPLQYFNAKRPVYETAFVFERRAAEESDAVSDSSKESVASSSSTGDEYGTNGTLRIHLIPEAWDISASHSVLALNYTVRTATTCPKRSAPATKSITTFYCPHGSTPQTLVPYLTACAATSSTATGIESPAHISDNNNTNVLIHACNKSQGPWYFGAPTYVYGARSGVQVANLLDARAWIRAHDEDKSPSGVATSGIRNECNSAHDVRRMMQHEQQGLGERCEFVELGAGEVWRLV